MTGLTSRRICGGMVSGWCCAEMLVGRKYIVLVTVNARNSGNFVGCRMRDGTIGG